MKIFLARLKALVQHPGTQLVTGFILLVSGGTEVVFDFVDAEHKFRLGAHHGVALFGLIQMLGSLPDRRRVGPFVRSDRRAREIALSLLFRSSRRE